jgi:hypothetical protein
MLDASSAPYFVAAATCFLLISVRAASTAPLLKVQSQAWKMICIIVALLGLVRPYEVHSMFSAALRTSAVTGGWYNERVHHQLDLLLVAAFVAAVLAAFLLFETRKWHLSTQIAALAAFYLCGAFVVNVLSLHGLDQLLNRRLAGVPLRWAVDFLGLSTIIAAALFFRFHGRKRLKPEPRNSAED